MRYMRPKVRPDLSCLDNSDFTHLGNGKPHLNLTNIDLTNIDLTRPTPTKPRPIIDCDFTNIKVRHIKHGPLKNTTTISNKT